MEKGKLNDNDELDKENVSVRPISWLVGNWYGQSGSGDYPTIEPFNYKEELEITHPTQTQPIFHTKFSSWFEDRVNIDRIYRHFESPNEQELQRIQKKPAHFELGFLRVKPNSSPLFVSYTSTHNNGVNIIEEGTYDESRKLLTLNSINIARTTISNPPFVLQTKREFQYINEDSMEYKMYMATSSNPKIDLHLTVEYFKAD